MVRDFGQKCEFVGRLPVHARPKFAGMAASLFFGVKVVV